MEDHRFRECVPSHGWTDSVASTFLWATVLDCNPPSDAIPVAEAFLLAIAHVLCWCDQTAWDGLEVTDPGLCWACGAAAAVADICRDVRDCAVQFLSH